MITYKEIYDFARHERYSKELQKLPLNFIIDVATYLREKKDIALKESKDFSDVITNTKKQFENASTLFKELIRKRREKILQLVHIAFETGVSKKDFDNMLDFEKELFDELMKSVENSDKKISEMVNNKNSNGGEMITFKESVGEFLDLNGDKMGGFEKGETVIIPKEIAKILIDDGKAELDV